MLQKIQKMIQKLTEKGQGTVEYALLLAVVAAVAYKLVLANDGIAAQSTKSIDNMKTEATNANALYDAAKGTGTTAGG